MTTRRDSAVRVAAVVVAFNAGDDLRSCLGALRAAEQGDHEILVVDNASGDGSTDELERWGQTLGPGPFGVLRLPENRGFAGGVNAGLSYLMDVSAARPDSGSRPDVVVLVNQDCEVEAGWLAPMLSCLQQRPEVALVGARLFDLDGCTVQHAGGIIHANGLTDHHGRGQQDGNGDEQPREVEYVSAALCAFRLDTWSRFGPFDEGYFPAYFEETDFCVRARRAGMLCVYLPASRARHREAGSTGKGSARFLRYYHRNRLRFCAIHLMGRGKSLAWLRAEARWLLGLRSTEQVPALLAAYKEVPHFLREKRRRAAVESSIPGTSVSGEAPT